VLVFEADEGEKHQKTNQYTKRRKPIRKWSSWFALSSWPSPSQWCSQTVRQWRHRRQRWRQRPRQWAQHTRRPVSFSHSRCWPFYLLYSSASSKSFPPLPADRRNGACVSMPCNQKNVHLKTTQKIKNLLWKRHHIIISDHNVRPCVDNLNIVFMMFIVL